MSNTDFHLTRMGHRFFEATLPNLVDELAKLNAHLGRIVALLEQRSHTPPAVQQEPTRTKENQR
ncbi:MAG: hypothetical protein ACTHU0_24935 [Kofleriaceae bacterium]